MTTLGPTRGLATFAEHDMAAHLVDVILRDRFLYAPQFGWMEWDGIVWRRHSDREGLAVKRTFRHYIEAWARRELTTLMPNQLAALVGYLKASGLDRLEKAVKTFDGVSVDALWFDRDTKLVNTPNGVLDLLDGSVTPHDPVHGLTRITGASYRPGATSADWDQALRALPDDETREWLQCYLGRGLIGEQGGLEFVPFLLGTGSNGKSLIVGSVMRAIGDYGGIVADELLAGKVHEEHIMRLRGMRLAVVEEMTDGHRLNVARLKQIVGTDKMLGRHLYREPLQWTPTHSLVVTSNYLPVVPETDHGTWRRLVGVPFPHEFEPDHRLKQSCYEDVDTQEAVLAWLVEGAMKPMPTELPQAVADHTDHWRRSVDLIAQFYDECLEPDPGSRLSRAAVLDQFNDFASGWGHRRLTGRVFTERFKDHKITKAWGVTEAISRGTRQWQGIAIKAPSMSPGGNP